MNLRDLKYLVAVADYGHFGKAAEVCHVSQPTLSMQIKKLESLLGIQLIERSNRKVMLTRVGEEVVARARQVVNSASDIVALAKAAKDPYSAELRLASFPTIAPYLLPVAVPEIKKNFPRLKLLLVEEKTAAIIEKLESGEVDAAILAMPILNENLTSKFLFEEPFYLAVSKKHKLASYKQVSLKDFQNVEMLLLDDGHCLREQTLEVCQRIGVGEAAGFRATSLETLRQMVLSGGVITLMPKLAINKGDKQIAYIPFERKVAPSRKIGFYWRKTSARGDLFQQIAEIVSASAQSQLAKP